MEDVLYIIIPAYNEEENIENVIRDWYPIVEQHHGNGESRLVIIDDGSKDNTFSIIQRCAQDRPFLVPLTKNNSGHGATLLYGYRYAVAKGANFIFQTDSDGQTLPSEFSQFWECRNMYDMVIGWRNKREDGWSRVFVTKVLKFVIRICFRVSVLDANTPYRLMNAHSLKEIIKSIPKDYNLSNVLISVIFIKRKKKVKFIPITFRPRQGGENSINIKSIFKIGRNALRDFLVLNRKMKGTE